MEQIGGNFIIVLYQLVRVCAYLMNLVIEDLIMEKKDCRIKFLLGILDPP